MNPLQAIKRLVMINMYAIVKKKREPGAEITTVDASKIGRSGALVEVRAATIRGSDIHIWNRNEWAQNRVKKIPSILGHEVVREVVEVGSDVTSVQIGDVVSETQIVDGTHQCMTDRMRAYQNEALGVDGDGVFGVCGLATERNA